MLERELEPQKHYGCPNRHHCTKDDTKCAYLSNGRCLINEYEENYLFKERREK